MRIKSTVTLILFSFLCVSGAGFPEETSGIRAIDFKNFSFAWDNDTAKPPSDPVNLWHWATSLPTSEVRLKSGVHHFCEPNQSAFERERSPMLRLSAIAYGDLDGDREEEAAVQLNYTEGGTANWDYVYIYKMERRRPRLLALLHGGSRGYAGLYRTAIRGGLLILDFADPERRSGDCCSEGFIRVHYRWKSARFVEEGARSHGDIDLNAH